MKSPLIQIIIKVLAVIAISGSMFYFLIAPKLAELVKNELEIEKLGFDLKKADDKLSALKEIEKKQIELKQTKDDVFGLLPEEPSASTFILNIENMSRQVGIVVDSLSVNEVKVTKTSKKTTDSEASSKSTAAQTTPTTKNQTEKALSYTASFTSDYNKGQSFLKALEMLPRFNDVEVLSLGSFQLDNQTMNFKVEGKIYYGR